MMQTVTREVDFDTLMCRAARNREIVELIDGRIGQLVYWPGRNAAERARKKRLRHGDPLMAGVRTDPNNASFVAAVPPLDIIGIVAS